MTSHELDSVLIGSTDIKYNILYFSQVSATMSAALKSVDHHEIAIFDESKER